MQTRYNITAAIKRPGALEPDGAGGVVEAAASIVIAVWQCLMWVPSAYQRTILRTEHGLDTKANIKNFSGEYDADMQVNDQIVISDTETWRVLGLVGVQGGSTDYVRVSGIAIQEH